MCVDLFTVYIFQLSYSQLAARNNFSKTESHDAKVSDYNDIFTRLVIT